jgi:hypothetical protein
LPVFSLLGALFLGTDQIHGAFCPESGSMGLRSHHSMVSGDLIYRYFGDVNDFILFVGYWGFPSLYLAMVM